MKEDIKNRNKRKSDFDVVVLGAGGDQYIPSSQDLKDIERQKVQDALAQAEARPKPEISQTEARPQPNISQAPVAPNPEPRRRGSGVKKARNEWSKNPNPEIKPVEDKSQERKPWARPTPVPDSSNEEEFKIVNVEQDQKPTTIVHQAPDNQPYNMPYPQNYNQPMQPQEIVDQFTSDFYQFERMIADMKSNLLSETIEQDSSPVEEIIESPEELKITPKEQVLVQSEPKVVELPSITEEEAEDREDLDDITPESAEEEAKMKSVTFGGINEVMKDSKDAQENGAKIDHDLEEYNTYERIKEYLENEIGEEILTKAHPILKQFGEDILYENNIPEVTEKLKGILSEEDVHKYLHFFATLVFFENQTEKLSQDGDRKEKENESFNQESPKSDSTKVSDVNFTTFKNIQPSDTQLLKEDEDNIFKNAPQGKIDYDKTAKFGHM